MIDNYDSFSYNLYQYLSQLGANVRVVRNDEVTIEQVEVRFFLSLLSSS
jgi:anthranilate synthase component 2